MKICFLLVYNSTFLPSGLIIFIFETCQPFSPKKSDQTDGNVYLKSGTNKNLTILDSSILLILKSLINEHARLAFLIFFLLSIFHLTNEKNFNYTLIFHVTNEKIFPSYTFILVYSFISSEQCEILTNTSI